MKGPFFKFLGVALATLSLESRSLLRPAEILPEITTRWSEDSVSFTLKDSHLEEGPVFHTFDKKFFYKHLLPSGPIKYRHHPEQMVTGKKLSELIEHLIVEIKQHKRFFRDFIPIKTREFQQKDFCGLLVLKFKNYPFVLKLFAENPKSFVSPYSKGFESSLFFVMGRGIMRHLTGFTRIQNLEEVKVMIAQDPYWSSIIDMPRKWYWMPKKNDWIEVTGKHINGKDDLKIDIPALYGLVCDEIQIDHSPNLFQRHHARRCMRLCQYVNFQLDPHIKNFYIEKETGKLALIDTEHFHMLCGVDETWKADNYTSWYLKLTGKYLKDKFFRTKSERIRAQQPRT
ncbi:hypothetical protein JW872_02850 [Candidatus Babeliales bacterium]|nr:hypothetical protein [Candidatus Babeliales bacterium]